MKKLVLLVLVLIVTSFSAGSQRTNRESDFSNSVFQMKHEADSLNTLIKHYNEKKD